MSAGYELDIRRQNELYDYQNQGIGAANCGQQLCQQSMLGYGTPYWVTPCPCPSLGDYEISIQQIGDGEPLLNYGAKLRLLMAEPIKGIDLREAIAKLKLALKECTK